MNEALRVFSDALKSAAASGNEWAVELVDAYAGAGIKIETLARLVTSRAFLSDKWGIGDERVQRINALSEVEAKSEIAHLLHHIEHVTKVSGALAFVLINRKRTAATQTAKNAAAARKKKDSAGKFSAMSEIHAEWIRRKDSGVRMTATAFAKEMNLKHAGVVTVEAVKNAQTRWLKAYHPTR